MRGLMQHDVLIDGVEAEGGWLRERAFQFGDGLFETIAIIDENSLSVGGTYGTSRRGLPSPAVCRFPTSVFSPRKVAVFVPVIDALCSKFTGRPVNPSVATADPAISILERDPASLRVAEQKPMEWLCARRCTHRLSENPALAGIKHLNRLDQVIARAEWEDEQYRGRSDARAGRPCRVRYHEQCPDTAWGRPC